MSLTDRFITVHPPVHAKLVLIRFNPSILAIIGPGSFSTNLIVKPADIFGTSFKHLYEQLYPAQKVMKQKKLLDQFFLKYIQDKEQRTDHRITFGRSTESTRYVRRAVAALYQDELRLKKTGRSWSVGRLAKEYDFKDKDGTQPEAFVLPEA